MMMLNFLCGINCRGAGHENFCRQFLNYKIIHSPNVVAIIESKISRNRVDDVIRSLDFHYSFRVEACGFKGRNLDFVVKYFKFSYY